MGELTVSQYSIMVNLLSVTISIMGVAAIFFFAQRTEVLPRYQIGVTLLAFITGVSAVGYYRLYGNWTESYSVVNGAVRASGIMFNNTLRASEWVLTVPMTLVAFVRMLDISPAQARARSIVLSILGAEMVLLGYPGQLATTVEARWLWWGVSLAPAVVIVYQLYVGLSAAIAAEPLASKALVRRARLLLVATWALYPVFYLLPMFGASGGAAFTALEAGYATADILSKVFLGWMLYRVAAVKSLPVEEVPVLAGTLRAVKG